MKTAILTAVLAVCVAAPAVAGDRYHRDYHRDGHRYHHDHGRHYDDGYYCKRDKGTGGAIAGAVGGAIFGNAVAGHGDKALGTVVGAGAGALVGRELDRGDVKCRYR
ncbi:MAG: glycine zipper 2TM domain-containing protein [Sphingomonadales bacterium]